MKYFFLLLATFLFLACSKEEGYGRFNLKDGQEVELFVDHKYGAVGDVPLLLPQNEAPELPLSSFTSRKPGYNYRIKARMSAYKGPTMMDGGPGHSLIFTGIISEERYLGDESFRLSLVRSVIPGPNLVILRKEGEKFIHWLETGDEIELTDNDPMVGSKLEEIWQFNKGNLLYDNNHAPLPSKWRSIIATVTHDQENFGRAYLVSDLKFVE